MLRFLSVTYLLLIALFASYGAEARAYNFEHLTTRDGLSHNSITSVVQDSLGVIWVGTRYGLNSYDGSHIRIYESHVGDENSLIENQVRDLKMDGMMLYIQTFNYLTIYDIERERFTNINIPNITSISLDRGSLWITTLDSIKRMDLGSRAIEEFDLVGDGSQAFSSIITCRDGVYVGSERGLFLFDPVGCAFTEVVEGVNVIYQYVDNDGHLWVATSSSGVYMIDREGEISNFRTPSISHNFVRRICQDEQGRIWIGTYRGLDLLDVESATSTSYSSKKGDSTQLSQSSVWSIFCDRDGVLWIGTYFSGLNILDPLAPSFRFYILDDSGSRGSLGSIVGVMLEDQSGNIYVGTHGGGVNYLEPETGAITRYVSNRRDPYSLGCNSVQDIYIHSDREVLMATNTDGLNIFNPQTKRFRTLSSTIPSAGVMKRGNVGDIEPYSDGCYLLSTHSGVYVCDLERDQLKPLIEGGDNTLMHMRISLCKVDSRGLIWIGSETNGLYIYNPESGELRRYSFDPTSKSSLSSNEINSIYEDRNHRIWVSTPSGLSLYNPEEDGFENFNSRDGLPSNTVYEVADSKCEDLLVTTDRGVSLFSLESREFKNFTADNGLPLTRVTHRSLLYSESGRVYIGGHNGMVSFVEREQFRGDRVGRGVNITGLRIGGEYVTAMDSTRILDRCVMLSDGVDLNYDQNSITIDFSDMSMTNHSRGELEYMLDGFDSDYIAVSGACSATYSNLPYKRYRFNVRRVGVEGDSSAMDSLDIDIRPPFYLSIAAFMLYFVLFVVVLSLILYLYNLRRVAILNLQAEQRDHQRDREYDQAKLRFFTNISHELRTPLSLISGQLEYIMGESSLSAVVTRRATQAFNSVKKLQSLVDELLDFRKQQNGYSLLLLRCEDMESVIQEVFANYQEFAAYRDIDYSFVVESEEQIYAMCDRNEIEKVLFNLLSNAFKFTTRGSISISLSSEGGVVVIEVRDSGIGIEPQNVERIFDRFYQEGRTEIDEQMAQGAGIGLSLVKYIVAEHGGEISVESRVGEGSCFRFTLPKAEVDNEEAEAIDGGSDLSLKAIKRSILLESESSVDDILNSLNERAQSGVDDRLILIVEDDLPLQSFLVELFSKYYRVERASDGEEGYRKAREMQPSLILSDMMKGGVTGVQICSMVKRDDATSHIPVVLLTERATVEQSVEGYALGVDDYISKPFSVKLLLARVENILESRRVLHEQFAKEPTITLKQLFTPEDEDEEFLTRAFNIVVENISNENYTVDQFASDMFMGRTTFFKRLKGAVDMTPNEFILTVRLKRAVEMLKSPSSYLIADIADKCGFNSQQYFCSCFKRKFGVSPAQYAKEGR